MKILIKILFIWKDLRQHVLKIVLNLINKGHLCVGENKHIALKLT